MNKDTPLYALFKRSAYAGYTNYKDVSRDTPHKTHWSIQIPHPTDLIVGWCIYLPEDLLNLTIEEFLVKYSLGLIIDTSYYLYPHSYFITYLQELIKDD